MTRRLRILAALLVMAAAVVIAARLAPVYWTAYRFQRYLAELAAVADDAHWPEERVRAAVLNRAAELGLPIRSEQVRAERAAGGLELEVRYVTPVRLSYYRVDLHFRPHVRSR